MQRIVKTFGLLEFEKALARVARGDHQLLLPKKLKAEAVGATAALLQLLASWGRHADAELRVYAENETDPVLSSFARTPIGLTAFNMARVITSEAGEPISRRVALALSEPFVRAMHEGHWRDLKGHGTIALLCLDNAKHLGRPARLYDAATESVRPARDLADVLLRSLEALGVMQQRLEEARSTLPAAAAIVFEAFQNTHEHARADFRGNQLPRSTRGVLIGYRYLPANSLEAASDGHEVLTRYFAGWRRSRPAAQMAQFLELSIFDSGSGLAQTWMARHDGLKVGLEEAQISLASEMEAVHACLRKGGTTKNNRSAGNGLFRILSLASDNGGFVRLRTGRLSLGRAFSEAEILEPNDAVMEDLLTGGPPVEPLAWAEGTVLTIMLPLTPAPVA